MTSSKIDGHQLELFAQDFFASLEPSSKPAAPVQPLFKAPPAPPRVTFPVPPRGPNDPPLRRIVLGAHAVEFALRRSARRSIGFMIDDDGLRVTAPKRVTLAEVDNAIRAKQRWILSKLHERGERRVQRLQKPPLVWEDGAQLPYMGGELTLRLEPAARSHCRFDEDTRELSLGVVPGLSEWQLKERVRLWYQDEARRVFAERLDMYAVRMELSYKAFALSSAGTRWGSCTIGGHIRLNWRLIHYPLALIDYVVVHELAHLREMNHSARFWEVVGAVYPDYDGARVALRKHSHEMPVLFED
ncbi:M48 family metallopeptidase [Massilia agilis]|uniref:M48 family metallopeptidase n=1 Tax=Massilia agilis TaxID=1811226 RepID=A0ABT2DF41_9BURK|nr:SprT family zinc-dependent metalloprotease [Massilia agilis]MCS0809831.1 M48 family metallopeptidase [Massilia agilis]